MDPNTILHILELVLELGADAAKHIPDAEKEAFWKAHWERVHWWETLFRKLPGVENLP